ncbi:FAD-dependent oxidoreductase [Streptomyces luteogriseus]|uniref:FAD-dependent oxidoreductase n=1 Tax=Streptomyces luteogriseus TaxID=68233 RepID=UPI003800EF4B
MRATQRDLAENFGHETKLLTRDELRSELGSDHYQGALLDPLSAALHVGKYVHGLAEAAERARFAPSDPASVIKSGDILKREMTEIFPQLAGVRGWGGMVGFSWDRLPHAGEADGLSCSMGYCGHGVRMATSMGRAVAEMMDGRPGQPAARPRLPEGPGPLQRHRVVPAVRRCLLQGEGQAALTARTTGREGEGMKT